MDETGKDLSNLFPIPTGDQSPPVNDTAALLPRLEVSLSAVVPTEELISELFRTIDEQPSLQLIESNLLNLPTLQAPGPQLEDSSSPRTRVEPKNRENLNTGAQFKCHVTSTTCDTKKAMFGHMRMHSNKGSYSCKNHTSKTQKTKAKPVPDLCKVTSHWTVTEKQSHTEGADRTVPVQAPPSTAIGMSNSTRDCQSERSEMSEFSPEEEKVAAIMIDLPNLIHNCESLKRRMPESEKREKKKRRIEESAPSKDKKHTCQICNKTFPSHQALGGHCSSHKILKKNPVSLDSAELKSGNMKENFKRNATSGSHVCEICGEGYETGQKLGGHKRRHYKK